MGLNFILTIIANSIIPCLNFYQSITQKSMMDTLQLYEQLQFEKNTVVDKFISLKIPMKTRLDSQSILYMKKMYCDQKKCLECAIGLYWLRRIE